MSAQYYLRSAKRKASEEAEREDIDVERSNKVANSIYYISMNFKRILKVVLDSATPQMIPSIVSDIRYKIGKHSISSNFEFLAEFFNMRLIAPIRYNISEDMTTITINILYNKRASSDRQYNCFTIILQKHNPIEEIVSICPNIWEQDSTPIVNEMTGNIFNLKISDGGNNIFIITSINFGVCPIDINFNTFLEKVLKLNIDTLLPSILNNIHTIKHTLGGTLSNLYFIFQWFNIKDVINGQSTMINDNTILFKMVLRMRDARTKQSMMNICLRRCDGPVESIRTNIEAQERTNIQYTMVANTFAYNINNPNNGNSSDGDPNYDNMGGTWIISDIDFC